RQLHKHPRLRPLPQPPPDSLHDHPRMLRRIQRIREDDEGVPRGRVRRRARSDGGPVQHPARGGPAARRQGRGVGGGVAAEVGQDGGQVGEVDGGGEEGGGGEAQEAGAGAELEDAEGARAGRGEVVREGGEAPGEQVGGGPGLVAEVVGGQGWLVEGQGDRGGGGGGGGGDGEGAGQGGLGWGSPSGRQHAPPRSKTTHVYKNKQKNNNPPLLPARSHSRALAAPHTRSRASSPRTHPSPLFTTPVSHPATCASRSLSLLPPAALPAPASHGPGASATLSSARSSGCSGGWV
ncbi:hypothetical protein FGG08_003200, partial [Glutinoglossum americanum]